MFHLVKDVQRRPPQRTKTLLPVERIDWAASGWAGIIGGGGFILIQTILMTLFTGGAGGDAVRQIAAIALGGEALAHPATRFTALVFLAAMAVHLPLSLIYARLLAPFVHGRPVGRAVAIGTAFGVALYAVNYYAFTSVFPWFAAGRGWITLVAHASFGALAAGTYVRFTARRR